LLYDIELRTGVLAKRNFGVGLAGGRGIVTPWPTDDPGLSREGRRELQTLLAKRGYDVGALDGAIGAEGLESHPALTAASRTKGERKGCR
jgi:hypothetical protein